MLAKKQRLPIQDFFYKKAQATAKSTYFLLKLFPNNLNQSRLGVIVSKAVAPKATSRNKIRRIVFDVFSDNIIQLPKKDFLVIALSKTASLSKKALIEELKKIFFVKIS